MSDVPRESHEALFDLGSSVVEGLRTDRRLVVERACSPVAVLTSASSPQGADDADAWGEVSGRAPAARDGPARRVSAGI